MKREQIVVLGAGIGGLLAAGAAAPYFDRVIVVEKDQLPDQPLAEPVPRKGVPQGPQVHAIIKRGENTITGIFPDFPDRMRAAGSATVIAGWNLQVHEGGGWHPRRDFGFSIFAQTRALMEQVIRGCLLDLANVTLKAGCRFTGLDLSDNGAVKAVRISGDDPGGGDIAADLVVDAMGRGSPMPKWLDDHGHGMVRRSRAGINIHYVTMLLRRPEAYRDSADAWVIRAKAPAKVRGATLIPIEGGRWLLTLASRFGDLPPLDFPDCLEFARSVEGGVLYDLIKDTEVTTAPRRFMVPEALLAHFDEMDDLPAGLLPLGDVIGNFNPMLAQGMTIASLHAESLGHCLQQLGKPGGDLQSVSHDYISAAVAISETAWQAAVNADFAYPKTEGNRPPDLAEQQKFRRAVREIIETDADLHKAAIDVQQMLQPGSALARPDVLERVRELS
ncbi:MAG: FAD-dependent oxidoreductase [Rhodospirillaceae bacterium]|nr:FAD-dependent oxidoreductase [Rhodospirillaceae bacterium]